MSSLLSLLLLSLFSLQSCASPWRPIGVIKRAFGDGQQHERRGDDSSPEAYGEWSSASTQGSPQTTAGWGVQSVTTTEEFWRTATLPSWTTTTAEGGGIVSWRTPATYETSENYKTYTVTETYKKSCSVASPLTVFTTIVSSVQAPTNTIITTVTETQTRAGTTVIQQVPTTIISTIVSTPAGSCTPIGPVSKTKDGFNSAQVNEL